MELDNIISDLEGKGYEVQPFIIPACAIDAPHRRDRAWIVAHTNSGRFSKSGICQEQQGRAEIVGTGEVIPHPPLGGQPIGGSASRKAGQFDGGGETLSNGPNSGYFGREREPGNDARESEGRGDSGSGSGSDVRGEIMADTQGNPQRPRLCPDEQGGKRRGRSGNGSRWPVESGFCRVAHGIPLRVDRLKSLGNSIVPKIAEILFRAIKETEGLK